MGVLFEEALVLWMHKRESRTGLSPEIRPGILQAWKWRPFYRFLGVERHVWSCQQHFGKV